MSIASPLAARRRRHWSSAALARRCGRWQPAAPAGPRRRRPCRRLDRTARPRLGLWLSIAGVAVLALAVAGPAASVPVDARRRHGDPRRRRVQQHVGDRRRADPARRGEEGRDRVRRGPAEQRRHRRGRVPDRRADHRPAQCRPRGSRGRDPALADLRRHLAGRRHPHVAVGHHRQAGQPRPRTAPCPTSATGARPRSCCSPTARTPATPTRPRPPPTAAAERRACTSKRSASAPPHGATVEVDGYRIHTALDEDTLTDIAKTTGGSYHPASDAAAARRHRVAPSTCG